MNADKNSAEMSELRKGHARDIADQEKREQLKLDKPEKRVRQTSNVVPLPRYERWSPKYLTSKPSWNNSNAEQDRWTAWK